MPKGITWPQEMRNEAVRRGNGLFAYGYQAVSSGRRRGGPHLMGFTPSLTEEEACCLAAFLLNLTSNKKPLDWCVDALKKSLGNCNKRGGIKDA